MRRMVDREPERMRGRAAERLAGELERRGLTAPARLLADAHRPLGPLLADLGVAFGGLIGAVAGGRAGEIRELLSDEQALDRLIVELDRVEDRRAEPR